MIKLLNQIPTKPSITARLLLVVLIVFASNAVFKPAKIAAQIKVDESIKLNSFSLYEKRNPIDHVFTQIDTPTTHNKIAFLVGVGKYKYLKSLYNPVNDVSAMEAELRKLNYRIIRIDDPTLKSFNNAMKLYESELKEASIGLFFFSGHALEILSKSHLFFSNSTCNSIDDFELQSFALDRLIEKFKKYNVKTGIILLDACRTNPFSPELTADFKPRFSLKEGQVLSRVFIGYASQSGKGAFDGSKQNGLFTSILLKYIGDTSLTLDQIFNKVIKEMKISGNGQVPYKWMNFDGKVYLNNNNAQQPVIDEQYTLLTISRSAKIRIINQYEVRRLIRNYQAYITREKKSRYYVRAVISYNPS